MGLLKKKTGAKPNFVLFFGNFYFLKNKKKELIGFFSANTQGETLRLKPKTIFWGGRKKFIIVKLRKT